jgi:uncharacterized protein
MSDLIVGFGLVLVIEGLLWALAPQLAIRFLEAASAAPESTLRIAGWTAVGVGAGLVWLIRG